MSTVFDEIRQVAYVSDDMDRALRFLCDTAGIGPWFLAEDLSIPECRFRGQPLELHMDIALANSGAVQLEVIVQRSPAPSIYTEFMARHGTGLVPQHFSSWTSRFDAVMTTAQAKGFELVQEGRSRYGPFVYFQHPDEPDFTYEVTELTAERRSIFDQVRAAADGWDGRDKVRSGWPTPKV